MKIIRVRDAKEGGRKAFDIMNEEIKKGAVQVLGLATGSTPISLYEEIVTSSLDLSDKISINLDEYVGLSEESPQSYHYFMKEHLFAAKPFKKSYIPDGLATDEAAECQRYDQVIKENPIDLQILGIGKNGHIGFNEPGTSFTKKTHKVALTESTIEANKRFFDKAEDVPIYAYSMGIASIMKSKQIILMAYGDGKVDAVSKMVDGPVTTEVPASILQQHPNVILIVDEAAAAGLA